MTTAPISTSSRLSVAAGAQCLVVFGGMAALSWEVLWLIQSSLAFGVSAVGSAITLASTMAGMTLGSLVTGRVLRNRPVLRPLRLYGILELFVGASGFLMLPGFRLLESLDSSAYAVTPELAPVVQTIGIAFLLGPPTFALGATVPVFGLISRRHGTSVAALYGANTAGAAIGVLVISFVVLSRIGVAATCLLTASLNFVVFGAALLMSLRETERKTAVAATRPGDKISSSGYRITVASVVVFATGFATFGLEVAWFRALRAAFRSTTDSFAIILVSVLIPLAIAARLVPRLRRIGLGPDILLAVAAVSILLSTPLVERLDIAARAVDASSYWLVILQLQLLSMGALGPSMLFLGAALPWLLDEFPSASTCGLLYGINTVGAVLGSLFAAWVLLPSIGFAATSWILGAGVALAAFFAGRGRARWAWALAGVASLVVAILFTSSVGRTRVVGVSGSKGSRILAFEEAPDSTISVVERTKGDRHLYIDGFAASTEGTTSNHYMKWMGHLPMLLHENPRRALVICFGTGQTADAVRRELPQRLDIVDLNGAVFDMAPLFRANRGVLKDARVRPIVMDGRAWLRRTDERYDVVTLEPMPPHFVGMNALYSKDFYEIIARKLEPGGVVAQWLPIHLLPPFFAASVAATFHSVFPDSVLWLDPHVEGTGILLGRSPGGSSPLGADWPGLERAPIERLLTADQIRRSLVLNPEQLATYSQWGRVITDDNQLLAYGLVRRQIWEHGGSALWRSTRNRISRVAGRPVFMLKP
jgi:spermidine synthase